MGFAEALVPLGVIFVILGGGSYLRGEILRLRQFGRQRRTHAGKEEFERLLLPRDRRLQNLDLKYLGERHGVIEELRKQIAQQPPKAQH